MGEDVRGANPPPRKNMNIGPLIGALGSLFAVGILFANMVIALGVYRDAGALVRAPRGGPKIFSPGAWASICHFGSIPALAIYWAAHHSTLARE
jgi:hypothetical protein